MTDLMLGRTASGLFWMTRYMERMENTARLVEAGFRMSLTRSRSQRSEWESVLTTTGTKGLYLEQQTDFQTEQVVKFLLSDPDNPGSALSALQLARQNARMTRTALTRDTWEAINGAYLKLTGLLATPNVREELPSLLKAIQEQAALVRGTISGTMLRNDIYCFMTAGVMIERADNTARILDTKYYVLLPASASVGSSLDNVQWEMILRSASAERAFHWLHGGDITPSAIVNFLVHDVRLPRSIAYCYASLDNTVAMLDKTYGLETELHKSVKALRQHVTDSTSETIIHSGLHEFLLNLIQRNGALSKQFADTYRFNS